MPEEVEHGDWIDPEIGAEVRTYLSDAILDTPTDSIVACDRDGIIRSGIPTRSVTSGILRQKP
jgi:hypothetical protein